MGVEVYVGCFCGVHMVSGPMFVRVHLGYVCLPVRTHSEVKMGKVASRRV